MVWARRRFQRRHPAAALVVLLLLVLLASRGWLDSQPAPSAIDGELWRVQRVVDGDTLLMQGGTRVRLIGVDTPETKKENHPVEPWGPEATAFAEQFVAGGDVRLTYDGQRRDQYGRTLAYVWVDDRLLNEELIRAGLGRATLQYPFSGEMKQRFREAQEHARRQRLGIWSGSSP